MYNIMVVDDEKDIVKAIEIYLKTDNYNVLKAYNGFDALELMEKNKIDLFLVDIMMEGMDGLELTQKIREVSNAPIIILSAKSELNDKVMGLNLGADDYITKPFDAVELLARIKSCLRRLELSKDKSLNGNIFSAGRLTINDDKKEVLIDGEEIKLTPYEYGIILLLLKNKGIVFTSEEIYENVWEAPPYDVKKIVSVHISRLREKVEINPRRPDLIKSVYGMGYKIEDI
ncbi:response regulator transcription factor [Finegoldia magna]|uniref:Two-component response regulator n=3 Tax=Finegoldia magna TaxID=1260 RepID=B0S1S7_FINM2|nr:response regulator transcription factor [Finegoldia magna]EFK93840.1 response regulator receiver domain protein [Finegoldia magna ACS-171-V-Col3]EFL53462.1 response regulator receiver domain protein [Finegoldia magna BVS033A4]EGS33549.1 response regulator receiver domain protein [Finegoldia magna SY403409CC001050417]MBS6927059.1 response regulator transcription factor [Finegoldia magna]MDU1214183.1 response regulator transcription factor [Finegoldia magna]